MKWLLSTYLVLFSSQIFAECIETKNFKELLNYGNKNTLFILDIDDTLLIPTQSLGTDAWFIHRHKFYQKSGDCAWALDKALADWEAVRHLTNIKIVEDGTDQIIQKLQDDKITVMGLTTQGLALSARTINQLKSLNIDLSKTAPSGQDYYYMNGEGVLFRDGILFTSGTPKGPALLKLMDLLDYSPKTVVFINDKLTHLKDVEKSLEEKGIPFIGLRYGICDQRVAQFRPEIAEIQWNHSTFGKILSDEEAEKLLPIH